MNPSRQGQTALVGLCLGALVFVSRVPFVSKYLLESDAVGYARGLEEYNVLVHQPHAPGALLLIGCARVLNWFFPDPNEALVALSVLATMIAAFFIWLLGSRLRDQRTGFTACLLFLTNPIVWFYGEVAAAYAIDAAASVAVAYCCYKAFDRGPGRMLASSLVFAVAIGFRQSLASLLLPLYLWSLVRNKSPLRWKFVSVATAGVLVALWTLITVQSSGGYEEYSAATRSLYADSFGETSLFFGASVGAALKNLTGFLVWTVMAGGLVASLAVAGISWRQGTEKRGFRARTFFALWILPAMAFYALIHIPKSGYALTYAPGLALIGAIGIREFCNRKHESARFAMAIVIAVALTQTTFFLGARPLNRDTIHSITKHAGLPDGGRFGYFINYFFLRYSARGIILFDDAFEGLLNTVRKTRKPRAMVALGDWARLSSYYLPQTDVIFLAHAPVRMFVFHADAEHRVRLHSRRQASLPQETQLIWVGYDRSQLPEGARDLPVSSNPYQPAVRQFGPDDSPIRYRGVKISWKEATLE